MYWPDVVELKGFYTSTLGSAVCRRLRSKLKRLLPELYADNTSCSSRVLGLGYVTPYLQPLLGKENITSYALMPSAQGVTHWPEHNQNKATFGKETNLPFEDESMDRIIVAHALEYTKFPHDMLNEIYRILAPQGKVVIIAPNRMSIWARGETSPFGYGHPYSVKQLQQLLESCQFETTQVEMALLFPPTRSRIMLRTAEWFFKLAQKVVSCPLVLRSWGGVILIEAEKQIFAAHIDHSTPIHRGFLYRPLPTSFGRSRKEVK